ncbi:hypothetical protein CHUAL_003949 [Chamberlinius hualienensis]
MAATGIVASNTEDILSAFYPLSLLGRLFGYFFFCNLERKVKNITECKCYKLTIDVMVSAVSLVMMIFSDIFYFNNWKGSFSNTVRSVVHDWFYGFYRLAGAILFISFIFQKQTSVIQLIQNLCHVHSGKLGKRVLMTLSITIAVALVIFSVHYAVVIDSYYYNRYSNWLERLSMLYGVTCVIFAHNFVPALTIFICYILIFNFEDLTDDLKSLIKCYEKVADFDKRLSSIRGRHERLVMLVDELNSVFSPLLMIYATAQLVSACVNVCEFCFRFLGSEPVFTLLREVSYIIIRATPLSLACICGTKLTQSVSKFK